MTPGGGPGPFRNTLAPRQAASSSKDFGCADSSFRASETRPGIQEDAGFLRAQE